MGKLKVNIKSPVSVFFLLFFGLFFICCSQEEPLLINEEIHIKLPEWPNFVKDTVELSGWQISIKGKYVNEEFFIPYNENQRDFSLTAPKNKHFSIKATPVTKNIDNTSETLFFMPAGSVYPDLYSDSGLQLTFEDGFTAYIMSLLETEDFSYADHFNWKKFSQVIQTRSSDQSIFYDPWKLNIQKITHGIRTGNFTSVLLNSPKTKIIEIPEPYPIFLYPYIPLNERFFKPDKIPIYENDKTFFMTDADTLLIIDARIANKLSHTTVFTPKFIHRDSVCKKE